MKRITCPPKRLGGINLHPCQCYINYLKSFVSLEPVYLSALIEEAISWGFDGPGEIYRYGETRYQNCIGCQTGFSNRLEIERNGLQEYRNTALQLVELVKKVEKSRRQFRGKKVSRELLRGRCNA